MEERLLLLLTFADQALADKNYLKKSCETFDVNLKVLIRNPWPQNVIKLKLLYEFLSQADPDLIVLVTDAYDVAITSSSNKILSRFKAQGADVLFSGESNFMYKEPKKWISFLRKYPKQATIFQFLNSGSYIGTAQKLKEMLEQIQKQLEIDLCDEQKLIPIKSDQYVLSRFYVESSFASNDLTLKIDSNHELLGVTGGRFCVLKFPDLSRWQAFAFFIFERNILKLFKLHRHQKVPKDYEARNGFFYNRRTGTSPPVMHFPGTWDRFDKVYDELLAGKVPEKSDGWIFAALVSFICYPLSILASPFFWLITRK
ncbi:MAG: glycosyltransferase domain-containing protein [Bacteroidota bacterium]